jgi:hypothetical protein
VSGLLFQTASLKEQRVKIKDRFGLVIPFDTRKASFVIALLLCLGSEILFPCSFIPALFH